MAWVPIFVSAPPPYSSEMGSPFPSLESAFGDPQYFGCLLLGASNLTMNLNELVTAAARLVENSLELKLGPPFHCPRKTSTILAAFIHTQDRR